MREREREADRECMLCLCVCVQQTSVQHSLCFSPSLPPQPSRRLRLQRLIACTSDALKQRRLSKRVVSSSDLWTQGVSDAQTAGHAECRTTPPPTHTHIPSHTHTHTHTHTHLHAPPRVLQDVLDSQAVWGAVSSAISKRNGGGASAALSRVMRTANEKVCGVVYGS